MMLQGVALNLVAFANYRHNLQGQILVLFVITVAACEAGLALALFMGLYRRERSLDVSIWQELREPGLEPTIDLEALPTPPLAPSLPHLPVTGEEPLQPEETSHV
jgi:NADH-quinone oxidoreductase subunit K